MTDDRLHPRLTELLNHLANTRAEVRAAIDAVPHDRRRDRPVPDRWSVAEIVEHLAIVERRLTARLAEQIDRLRAASAEPEVDTASVLAQTDAGRFVNRSKRFVTRTGEPTGTLDADEAWRALEATREHLVGLLRSANGLPLGAARMPHPAFGELTLYEWIVFIGSHEERHANQIREVQAALTAASSGSAC